MSHGPSGRGAAWEIHPARTALGGVGVIELVDDLLGLARFVRHILGGTTLLATSEHVTVLPGRVRPKRSCSRPG